MEDATVRRVRQANELLQLFLRRIGEALSGRGNFTVEDVRSIAGPVRAMAPLVSSSEPLCAARPELQQEFEAYARNLTAMDQALDRVRCVLLARRTQIEAQCGHLETVRLWADAWRQTQ